MRESQGRRNENERISGSEDKGIKGEARRKEEKIKGTGIRHRSRRNEKDNGILRNVRQRNRIRKYNYNIYKVLEFIDQHEHREC